MSDQLLRPDGRFRQFCRDYRISPRRIRFNERTIHVVSGTDGKPLEDVRTPEDNLRVANMALQLVRRFTQDPAVSLHASVAGGRKTMGLFLGIAFQLFARPQDRLSHVLVSPPDLEAPKGTFFYPRPAAAFYEGAGKRIPARDVRVELAETPVLLLRDRIRAGDLAQSSYSALIQQAQLELDREASPPALILLTQARSLRIADRTIELTPLEFAVYHLLADRRSRCPTPRCPGCQACALEATQFDQPAVLADLRQRLERFGGHDSRLLELKGFRDAAYKRFREVRSRIHGKIRQMLGSGQWVEGYLIAASGKRPGTKYHIPAAPGTIRMA